MRWSIRRQMGLRVLAAGTLCAVGAYARAGISVGSFATTAETNAYAPFSQAQYFDQRMVGMVSPAIVDVADDWTGTNVGGTTNTWHWVGASHAETTTTFDGTSLTITAAGSFSYDMTTTSDFVDPIHSGGVFTPGGSALYECHFTVDAPATYRLSGQLNGFGQVGLDADAGRVFFFGSNSGAFERSGTIPPGQYGLLFGTGNGMGQLPNGVNHRALSGTFSVPEFTVVVPEPGAMLIVIGTSAFAPRPRRTAAIRSQATSRKIG